MRDGTEPDGSRAGHLPAAGNRAQGPGCSAQEVLRFVWQPITPGRPRFGAVEPCSSRAGETLLGVSTGPQHVSHHLLPSCCQNRRSRGLYRGVFPGDRCKHSSAFSDCTTIAISQWPGISPPTAWMSWSGTGPQVSPAQPVPSPAHGDATSRRTG